MVEIGISGAKTGVFLFFVIQFKALYLFCANQLTILSVETGHSLKEFADYADYFVKFGGAIYIALKIYLIIKNKILKIKEDKTDKKNELNTD